MKKPLFSAWNYLSVVQTISFRCCFLFLLSLFKCASHFQCHIILTHTLTHQIKRMKLQNFYVNTSITPPSLSVSFSLSLFLSFFPGFCCYCCWKMGKQKWISKLPAVWWHVFNLFIVEISYQLHLSNPIDVLLLFYFITI